MTTTSSSKNRLGRIVKYAFLSLGVVALLFAGLCAWAIGPRLWYVSSEYGTAGVIQATDDYVTAHPGRWPRSWADLGLADQSSSTHFRFDLTPEEIVADRDLIYKAILPIAGHYYTYPHAREKLDAVYEKLRTWLESSRAGK